MKQYEKKILLTILFTVCQICLFAQSVYMHEAQEDSEHTDPITFIGILSLILFAGFICVIVKVINGMEGKKEKSFNNEKNKETQRYYSVRQNGGFVCPVCGKNVMDKNYISTFQSYDGKMHHVKFCTNCGDKYNRYKEELLSLQKEKEEMPTLLSVLILLLLVASGLYSLIVNCMKGDIFMGIVGMIMGPIIVGAFIGWIIFVIKNILKLFKPSKPFKTPTLEHVKKCNALEE